MKQRAQHLQQVCSDEVFVTVPENMKTNAGLILHSTVSLTLFNRALLLCYDKIRTNTKHIDNENFKMYLNLIIYNANEMLKQTRNPTIAPPDKSQNQTPAEITSRLVSVVPGMPMKISKNGLDESE